MPFDGPFIRHKGIWRRDAVPTEPVIFDRGSWLKSPKGLWLPDGHDYSGNGNDTHFNSGQTIVPSVRGPVVQTNNRGATVSPAPSLHAAVNTITLFALINYSALNQYNDFLTKNANKSGWGPLYWSWTLSLNPQPYFGVAINGASQGVAAPSNLPTNSWHTIVGVYDGQTQFIYVDGVLTNSVARGAYPIDYHNDGPVYLGWNVAANEGMTGQFGVLGIDDAAWTAGDAGRFNAESFAMLRSGTVQRVYPGASAVASPTTRQPVIWFGM